MQPYAGWRSACGPYAAASRSSLRSTWRCIGLHGACPMQMHYSKSLGRRPLEWSCLAPVDAGSSPVAWRWCLRCLMTSSSGQVIRQLIPRHDPFSDDRSLRIVDIPRIGRSREALLHQGSSFSGLGFLRRYTSGMATTRIPSAVALRVMPVSSLTKVTNVTPWPPDCSSRQVSRIS